MGENNSSDQIVGVPGVSKKTHPMGKLKNMWIQLIRII
jgi:hypothetical protein